MDHQDQVLLVQTSHIKKVILRKMVIWFLDFCVFEHLGNVGYHGVVKHLGVVANLGVLCARLDHKFPRLTFKHR